MDRHAKDCFSVGWESEGRASLDYESAEPTQTARLIVKRTPAKTGRRHVYLYDVEFDGELLVKCSANPACDLARALKARGVTGHIKVVDECGVHRYTVNIEKATRLTVLETEREGPRFVEWKPLKPGDESPRTGERGKS